MKQQHEENEAKKIVNDTLLATEAMIKRCVGHSADFRVDGALHRGIVLRCEADMLQKCVWVWVKPFNPELSYPWPFIKIDSNHFDTVYKLS